MPRRTPEDPVLATNKKAFHDYHVVERYEAGIKLTGTEVKSCRERAVTLTDAYVRIENGSAFLHHAHIAVYGQGNRYNHEPRQIRKLLLHKSEIRKLGQILGEKGGTVIPLRFYLKQGLVKVEIAYCQGKTHGDKRDSLRKKQDELEVRRAIRSR